MQWVAAAFGNNFVQLVILLYMELRLKPLYMVHGHIFSLLHVDVAYVATS